MKSLYSFLREHKKFKDAEITKRIEPSDKEGFNFKLIFNTSCSYCGQSVRTIWYSQMQVVNQSSRTFDSDNVGCDCPTKLVVEHQKLRTA